MIFRRAIRNELGQTASGAFIALLTIVITVALIRSLGQAANGRIDNESVVNFLLFSTLAYIPVVMVLTVFMAVMMTMSRAFRESEMAAWWSAGLSLGSWVGPVLRFAIPLSLVAAVFSAVITPWSRVQMDETVKRFEQRADVSKVSAGQFRQSGNGSRVFFIERESADRRSVEEIFVVTQSGDKTSVVTSAGGDVVTHDNGERYMVLREGARYDFARQAGDFDFMRFESYGIRLDPGFYLPPDPRLQTRDLRWLLADDSPAARGELLWRFGLPLSAVVLALLAIPLSFVNPRAGNSLNLLFALVIYFLYSNLLSMAQVWVSRGRLEFSMAFMLPPLLGLGTFAFLMWRRNRMSQSSSLRLWLLALAQKRKAD